MLKTLSGRAPSQNEEELRWLIDLMRARGVRSYLEIGARHGDTFHEIVTHLPPGSRAVAVDLPGGAWGQARSRPALEHAIADLVARGYQASLIFGDSQTAATRRLVAGRGPYDAILIDGDHMLPGVTADWCAYGPMAPLVAFHDIDGTGLSDKAGHRVEVPILWESIKTSGVAVREFISPGSRMGIGVVLR